MKFRTLAKKQSSKEEPWDSALSDLLNSFSTIDKMLAFNPQSIQSSTPVSNNQVIIQNSNTFFNGSKITKRRSSISSISGSSNQQSQKQSKENMKILDSVTINYPYHILSQDVLRFIPESQLKFIQPLIDCPNEYITKKKYVTNVDERSYLTVFEYQVNDNWIIWDYSTGYVFFTGLWKLYGNAKTDINKLIDKFPNINSQTVRRVRGGFLKIQGTWLPYDIVRDLCKKFCFNVRYCLIPLFGEDFPNQCLRPNDVNFGKLLDSSPNKRRRRASTNSSGILKPTKFKKNRSKSDSIHEYKGSKFPLLEMEEILKASKQLHDLSFSLKHPDSPLNEGENSFNYGGFKWSFNDGYNLKILGKDHSDDDESDDAVAIEDNYELDNIPKTNSSDQNLDKFIPKNYDGFETLLKAAHHLINTGSDLVVSTPPTTSEKQFTSPSSRGKMDITELLR